MPLTVQVADVKLLKPTANPEEAVAVTIKSASPYVLLASAPNVIV